MIYIPFDEKFSENMDRTKSHGDNPCIVCGRKCRALNKMVHVHDGFSTIVTEEEAEKLNASDDGSADMGMFPIGPDCLKKHPEILPYVQIKLPMPKKVDWFLYADLYRQVFGETVPDADILQDLSKRTEILNHSK